MNTINESPVPAGKLISQTIAMPRETNANGDIFGGWLLSQMDLAGAILAGRMAKGRVATVAIPTSKPWVLAQSPLVLRFGSAMTIKPSRAK